MTNTFCLAVFGWICIHYEAGILLLLQVFEYEEGAMPLKHRDDSDTDDDLDSYHDDCYSTDDYDDDEETAVKKPLKDLEWDDSTLSL